MHDQLTLPFRICFLRDKCDCSRPRSHTVSYTFQHTRSLSDSLTVSLSHTPTKSGAHSHTFSLRSGAPFLFAILTAFFFVFHSQFSLFFQPEQFAPNGHAMQDTDFYPVLASRLTSVSSIIAFRSLLGSWPLYSVYTTSMLATRSVREYKVGHQKQSAMENAGMFEANDGRPR